MSRLSILLGLSLITLGSTAYASPRHDLHLTIYSSDLALVQEQRPIDLEKGSQWLSLDDVSNQLIPESVRLQLPASARLMQQSFHHDPITLRRMLELHIGKEVDISQLNPASGEPSQRKATVLALENDRVTLRDQQKIVSLPIQGDWRFLFPTLPTALTAQPELRAQIHTDAAVSTELGLRYLSTGLSWEAYYDLNLDAQADHAALTCWVSLHNTTLSRWPQANIELVAGQINRARSPAIQYEGRKMLMLADSAGAAPTASLGQLGDYHLYTMNTPLSLDPGEQKQVPLFNLSDVPVSKHYRFDYSAGGGLYQRQFDPNADFLPASVALELNNDASTGQPLPAGLWRVFSSGKDRRVRLLGEDRSGHTPSGRSVELQLGKAFDVSGKRRQTQFKRVDKKETLSDWEVSLKNASDRAIVVEVNERLGLNWDIVQQSHPHQGQDAQQAQWRIPVPAKSEATLSYRVRIRQP